MSDRRPLKVLITSFACIPGWGSEPGTGWEWVSRISKVHEVHLITTELGQTKIAAVLDSDPTINLTPYYLPVGTAMLGTVGWMFCYLWQWRAGGLAVRLHRNQRFDICHSLNYFTWRVPSFLWRLGIPFVWGPLGGGQETPKGFRSVLGVRGLLEDTWRSAFQWSSRFDPFVRQAMRNATAIMYANQETLSRIPARFHHKVRQVWDAAIAARPTPAPPLRSGPLRILWAGRIIPWKGLILLIRALRHVTAAFHLTILGDGNDRTRCERAVRRFGLQDRIRFTGWLSVADKNAEFEAADIFVFTSLHDTSGMALIEAMATGLPVIALNCAGPRETVGNAGVRISVSSARTAECELAAAIQRLADNPEERHALSRKALRRMTEFSWEVRLRNILEIYNHTVSRVRYAPGDEESR